MQTFTILIPFCSIPVAYRSSSDFDAACGRARVPNVFPLPDTSSSGGAGATFEIESDSEPSPTSREARFEFPCGHSKGHGVEEFPSKTQDEKDDMAKNAAREIAKKLDLPVKQVLLTVCSFYAVHRNCASIFQSESWDRSNCSNLDPINFLVGTNIQD